VAATRTPRTRTWPRSKRRTSIWGFWGVDTGSRCPPGTQRHTRSTLHAERHGLSICAWALQADDHEGHQQSFLDEIRVFHVVPTFRSTEELQTQIQERLKAIAAEDLGLG
jgi:hypothetical protein